MKCDCRQLEPLASKRLGTNLIDQDGEHFDITLYFMNVHLKPSVKNNILCVNISTRY